MNDLFSPAASFGVVGSSILVSMVGYKAFATPALLADPSRRDWLHAFAAAVLSTAAIVVVLLASATSGGRLSTGLGAALVAQVVVVAAVYRSLVAGVALVVLTQLVALALGITMLLHPLAPTVLVTLWAGWLHQRDAPLTQRRSFLDR